MTNGFHRNTIDEQKMVAGHAVDRFDLVGLPVYPANPPLLVNSTLRTSLPPFSEGGLAGCQQDQSIASRLGTRGMFYDSRKSFVEPPYAAPLARWCRERAGQRASLPDSPLCWGR